MFCFCLFCFETENVPENLKKMKSFAKIQLGYRTMLRLDKLDIKMRAYNPDTQKAEAGGI